MSQPEFSKTADLAWLFAFLDHHKNGTWNLKGFAEKQGMSGAKAVENKLYRLRKTVGAAKSTTVGVEKGEGTTPSKAMGTPSKSTPASKKRKVDIMDDDEELNMPKEVKSEDA